MNTFYVNGIQISFKSLLFFFYLSFNLKMAFEIVHSGEKEKWQLPFMRQTNRKRKYRFPNYDQYDRREALKTSLQPSFFLNGNDEEEHVQDMLENPTVAKFAIANHSA